MTDKLILTSSVGLDNYSARIPELKKYIKNVEALEIMHFQWDYPAPRCSGPNEPANYETGKKIGIVLKENAPELEMLEVHYPYSFELMEREGQSLIQTLEEIRGIEECAPDLGSATINHHPVYLDPLSETDVSGRLDLLESQITQAKRAKKLIGAYKEKFDLKIRPKLLAEANCVFSSERFFGNSDMTQICAEDFEKMRLDGILFDYSHVHSDIHAHIEDDKKRDSLPNLKLLRNQYKGKLESFPISTCFQSAEKLQALDGNNVDNETPYSCKSFENYFQKLKNMNLGIEWVHLSDEKSAFSHNGFALLPKEKKIGYIDAELCLRRLEKQIPTGKRVGTTLEISTPPVFKPECWEVFKESYEFLSGLLAEI